jgi:hypothetical protein
MELLKMVNYQGEMYMLPCKWQDEYTCMTLFVQSVQQKLTPYSAQLGLN